MTPEEKLQQVAQAARETGWDSEKQRDLERLFRLRVRWSGC